MPRICRAGVLPGDAQPRRVRTWLLARSLYRMRHFNLSAVPMKDRKAALRAMVLAWAPFEAPHYEVALRGNNAWAWAWDESRVAQQLRALNAKPDARLLPEDAARPTLQRDGIELFRGLDGWDAQRWVAGVPVAFRWWPEPPNAADWAAFERQVDVAPEDATPLPKNPKLAKLMSSGWVVPAPLDELNGSWSRVEIIAAVATSTVLTGLTAAQAAQAWALHQQLQTREASLSQLRDRAGAALTARDKAQDLATQAGHLANQYDQPAPIEVLNHLTQWLPNRGVVVKDFELTGRVLRLGLDLAPEVPRAQVVKNLITGGWISEITELRDNSSRAGVLFEMRLVGKDPKTPGEAKRPETR